MSRDYAEMANNLVEDFLGHRLELAGDSPGLRETTEALLAAALESQRLEQLMRSQLGQLRNPSSSAYPDAYLAVEAAAEDALQGAAAGMRVAMAQSGRIIDPRSFERSAARRLGSDPRLAIRAELARVPRPANRPEALRWSLEPAPWTREREGTDTWPPVGLDATSSLRCLPGGASALARIDDGPHSGWFQIGMIERHLTPACRYPDRPERSVLICVGLEITDTEPPVASLPFTSSPWLPWIVPWQYLDPTATVDAAAHKLSTRSSPAVALVDAGHRTSRRAGLGDPLFLLAPALPLVVALGLTPTTEVCGFSLSDGTGPGLVGRQWRGHLVHDGNYLPLTPAVEGTDLILRPDLFVRLLEIVDGARIRAGVSASHCAGEVDGE